MANENERVVSEFCKTWHQKGLAKGKAEASAVKE